MNWMTLVDPALLPVLLPLVLFFLLALVLALFALRSSRSALAREHEVRQALESMAERLERLLRQEIAANRDELACSQRLARQELAEAIRALTEGVQQQLALQQGGLEGRSEALRSALGEQLADLRRETTLQLERIRATVDEQLQGTLDQRLGEAFQQVGTRLDQVARGLGEMQGLAAGLGDLRRILGNVKTRGTWGEVQLGALLEQVLAAGQYAANVPTARPGERVEFAVRLPGRDSAREEAVWLPIDAKFPLEDYQRLLAALDAGDGTAAENARRQLEQCIRSCAREISAKYLAPPATTDFAILFLPTEGLFAEVLRRPGLSDAVQRESRVVLAGPTTLWALLNSLQLGFRTLAIEQRSAEVWRLLAAVKSEWSRYGEVLGRIQRKLHEASSSLDQAQTRSRAIGRRLGSIQQLPTEEAGAMLELPDMPSGPEETKEM